MKLMIFPDPYKFVQFFLTPINIPFSKKTEAIIVQLILHLSGKFLRAIWNFVTKTYIKFVKLRSLQSFQKKIHKRKKRIEKIHMDSEKLINSFKIGKV